MMTDSDMEMNVDVICQLSIGCFMSGWETLSLRWIIIMLATLYL